jgi:hypothetical protein
MKQQINTEAELLGPLGSYHVPLPALAASPPLWQGSICPTRPLRYIRHGSSTAH